MSASEEEFRGSVPYCDDDFVAGEERVEGFVEEAGETEVADADGATGRYENVGWFEVAVEDPICVEVEEAVQELEEDGADHTGLDCVALRLGVVVDDLEEVMLGIFEDHEDAFVFEYDFFQLDDVGVREFCA